MLHLPELEMSEEKAQRFASAYHEFRRHFPIPAVDPKWVALATFVYVGYDTYQPAVKALAARKRGDAARPSSPVPPVPAMPPAPAPEPADWFTAQGSLN